MTKTLHVAIAGAAGDLGTVVFQELLETENVKLLVLRKHGSKSTYPSGTSIVDVDYSSVPDLTRALNGQDVVVSTVGAPGINSQFQLIDACVAADVKRFIPSDFGVDLGNINAQKLPLFIPKVKIQQDLVDQSKPGGLSYTFIYTGSFLDWGFENDMSFNALSDTPTIVGNGNLPFSGILLSTAGEAVVGVLNNLEATKNRAVFVRDYVTTQNELLSIARALAPERHIKPVHSDLDELEATANSRLEKGLYDMETFRPYIYRAMLDPAYRCDPLILDNELLGISGKTELQLTESMRRIFNK